MTDDVTGSVKVKIFDLSCCLVLWRILAVFDAKIPEINTECILDACKMHSNLSVTTFQLKAIHGQEVEKVNLNILGFDGVMFFRLRLSAKDAKRESYVVPTYGLGF